MIEAHNFHLTTIFSMSEIISMEIHPISEHFAAEVTGVNLARPLQPDDVNALQSALDTFSVLVIPDQALTEEAQVAFAAHFGPLETSISAAVYQAREKRRLAAPELSDISNLNTHGDLLGNQDLGHLINISNRL